MKTSESDVVCYMNLGNYNTFVKNLPDDVNHLRKVIEIAPMFFVDSEENIFYGETHWGDLRTCSNETLRQVYNSYVGHEISKNDRCSFMDYKVYWDRVNVRIEALRRTPNPVL